MTDTQQTIRPDEFAAHAASLRRLAHALVRCPAAADDAVQETWMRAMRTPRPAVQRLGSWLRTVLQNVVTSEHRSHSRHAQIERKLVTDDPGSSKHTPESDSTLDLVARRERLRLVSAAVGTLPTELQTVVFLRHFDAIPPREIAAKLQIPVSVVHKRLRSAHTKLRRELGEASPDGNWRAMLVGLFGLPKVPAPFWTPLGASQMLIQTKAGVAAVAVTVAAAAVTVPILLQTEKNPPVDPSTSTTARLIDSGTQQRPVDADDLSGAEAAARREAVDPTVQPEKLDAVSEALAALEEFEYEVIIHASNELDLPTADTPVWLAPENHALNVAGWTDDSGTLTVRFRGRKPTMNLMIGEGCIDLRTHTLEVQSGQPQHIAIQGPGPHSAFPMSVSESVSSLANMTEGRGEAQRFVANAWTKSTQSLSTTAVLNDFGFDISEEAPVDNSKKHHVETHLTCASGEPAAGAFVFATRQSDATRSYAVANKAGIAHLNLDPGTYDIRLGGIDHGQANRKVVAKEGGGTEILQVTLDRGAEIMGTMLDIDGKPLAGHVVYASSAAHDGAWSDTTTTDENGDFSIPNAPADRVHSVAVFAMAESHAHPLPLIEFETRTGPSRTTTLPFSQDTHHHVVANIAGDETLTTSGLRSRFRRTGSRYGVEGAVRSWTQLTCAMLPPGEYEISLGSPAVDWHVVSRVQCSTSPSDKPIDLGSLTLPNPGVLVLGETTLDSVFRLGDVASVLEAKHVQAQLVAPAGAGAAAGALKGTIVELDDVTNERVLTGRYVAAISRLAPVGLSAGEPNVAIRESARDVVFEESEPEEILEEVAEEVVGGVAFGESGGAGELPDMSSSVIIEHKVMEYTLAAGRYVAHIGDRFVQFEIAAGERLELSELLR